jgi:hypothetical protein
MTMAYQEYLELFDYFGRDGLPRLTVEEFAEYDRELTQLVARAHDLEAADAQRFLALQQLLLRERPTLKSLLSPRPRGRR